MAKQCLNCTSFILQGELPKALMYTIEVKREFYVYILFPFPFKCLEITPYDFGKFK